MSKFLLFTVFFLSVSEAWSALQYASQGVALKESRSTSEDLFAGEAAPASEGDPTCYRGLADGPKTVCCSPKCWTCGSHAMCNKPKKFFEITGNNNTDCCDSIIKLSQRKCEKHVSPCILSQKYRTEWKRQLTLPINEERHTRNKAVIKQRQFRFILYYKVKKQYDFATDIARDVRTLSNLKVKTAKANVKKFAGKLAAANAAATHLLKIGGNSTLAKGSGGPFHAHPISEAVWRAQLELNEDEARFYAQIRRNAIYVQNNCTEGLDRVDVMKVKVQRNIDKINSYDGEVKRLHLDANQTHKDALMLWKQWQNSAKHFNCTPTPVVAHAANKIAVPHTATRRVHVECQVGFDSNKSKNSLRCLKQGDFRKELYGQLSGIATCVGRNCGKPPEAKGANTVIQDIIHPNAAAYTCFEGHSMNGDAAGNKSFSVKCNKFGKFDYKEFTHKCEPIKCGNALKINNSFPIAGSFVFAQRLNYKCHKGYTIDGMAAGLPTFEITCLATGEFSAPQTCRPVRCGPTQTYDNTKLLTSAADQFFGMKQKYSCNEGYSLNQVYGGPTTFTLACHYSGEFVVDGRASATIPVCRAVSAGMAPKVDFGKFQRKEMFFGESALIAADNGYSFLSKVGTGLQFTLSVTSKGKYAGLKQFKPVECGAPPKVSEAKTTFTKPMAVFGDLLQYDCTKGYSVDKSKAVAKAKFAITCQADGTLSKIPGEGECVNIDDCAEHTCGPFGHCEDKLLNYTCVCNKGYEEQWDNKTEEKVCGNIDDCGPEACGVGECEDGLESYKCICPSGYEVKETAEGETCAKVTCGTPPRVQFAKTKPPNAQSEKIFYQGHVLYECQPGYTFDAKADGRNNWKIDCGADKDFTEGETCQPVDCGKAPSVAHASADGDTATFGETVKYECKEGYSIDATPDGDNHFKVTCQATGMYSQALECKPILCGEPDQVANANRPAGKLFYSDKIKYKCFEGFTIDGNRDSAAEFEAECLKTGKLTSLETCNPKVCGEPPKKINVLHATVPDLGKLRYPQVAEITCRDGFTVGGDPKGAKSFVVKCEKDGHFGDYDRRECKPVMCGDAPALVNSTFTRIVEAATGKELSTKKLTFGLRATYKCKPGFTAGGEFDAKKEVKAECMPSGAFSVPTPDLMCRNVDDCTQHTCGPKGTCVDLVGPAPAYTCNCQSGYEMRTMPNGEKFCGNIDDCGKDKCGPGVCQDLVNDFTCICPSGHFLTDVNKEKTCLPVVCAEKAPEVANSEREDSHKGAIVFPTTLRWNCKEGYSTDASPLDAKQKFQASCKAHGKLHGMMRCLPVSCGSPTVFAFTGLTFPASKRSSVEYGQSAKYKCHEGYTIHGAPGGSVVFETKCQKTGALEDPQVCEPVKCGKAPRMPKCRASVAGDVSYGQDVQYECDKGSTLTGVAGGAHHFHRKCTKDGTFSEAHGHCKPVSAGKAPAIRNAILLAHDGKSVADYPEVFYGQGLEYKCKSGHSLSGGPEGQTKFVAQANAQGKLVPALPDRCKPIVFKITGEIKNAATGEDLNGVRVSLLGKQERAVANTGFVTLGNIQAGSVRVKYQKDGFISAVKTIRVTGDISSGGDVDVNLSPMMTPKEWRAALKWNEYPYDLDTYGSWGTNKICWYNTFAQSGFEGKLEVDDTDGYGPETLHLSHVGDCDGDAFACDIKYMIHDYDETGDMFSDSGAEVTLYHGEAQAGKWKLKDCQGSLSEDGFWWHVFTINGKTNQLKWHCGMESMLMDVGPNATLSALKIASDFENYVGPFPGRYVGRRSRERLAAKAARLAGESKPKRLRSKTAK